MRCKKVQRLIPLVAGDEITGSKASMIRSHLHRCPLCREEYEKYVLLVQKTRNWFVEDRVDWEEREWQQTLKKIMSEKGTRRPSIVPWPFPKGWAFALMAGAVLLITALVVRPPFVEKIGLRPRHVDDAKVEALKAVEEGEQQEVVSMTMVSKETGLKIVWFFNKNFDLEEKQ
jgi:hypothetical protein